MEIFVERAADIRAVLADSRYVPVPPGPPGPMGSMAWLRSAVARFSHGPEHARRRALVESELARIDPERLRTAAAGSRRPAGEVAVAALAEVLGADGVGPGADGVALGADGVGPGVDGVALGADGVTLDADGVDAVVAAVPAVAAVYLAPGDAAAERAADDAVATLVALLAGASGAGDELVANRIGLLVQAHAATGGLVRAAAEHGSVADGLREGPPVRNTRRVATVDTRIGGTAVAAGDTLVLDLAAAGLPFGGEPRVCPGRAHALAIAEGALVARAGGASSGEAEQGPGGASSAEAEQRPAARVGGASSAEAEQGAGGASSAEAERRFRELHHRQWPLVLPNAWDHASAAALAARGFAAVGTTSLGVAAAAGKPDGTGATRDETVDLARRLRRLPCLITVDIEGGFSDRPEEVADLVAELAGLGVVGVNIEDGRADGTLAPIDHQRSVIGSVKSRVPGMFVNARTDTHWQRRPTPAALEEALRRVREYADAGADGVFVPGVSSDAAIGALVELAGVPLNVLFVPGLALERLAALGVRRVSTGSLLFRAALTAAVETAVTAAAGGTPANGLLSYVEVEALNELTAGARTTAM